ncbi:hypothetical protein [Klebsiella aerogenes]|nr:hypothetical protein [Klebsiella aerogenes]
MMNKIKNNVCRNNKGGAVYFSPPEKRDYSADYKITPSDNKKGN